MSESNSVLKEGACDSAYLCKVKLLGAHVTLAAPHFR